MSEEKNKDNNLPEDNLPTADNPSEEKAGTAVDSISEKAVAEKKITFGTFIISAVALVLAAVLLTFSISNSMYRNRLAELAEKEDFRSGAELSGAPMELLDVLRTIIHRDSIMELDEEEMMNAVYKAYVDATGDKYAEYYTQEEMDIITADSKGAAKGIGVRIIESKVTFDGSELSVIKIVNVIEGASAEKAGILAGDCIAWIKTDEGERSVTELKYDVALAMLKGEENTEVEFTVLRPSGDGYKKLEPFVIERTDYVVNSVSGRVSDLDGKVGVIRIETFNTNTPAEFSKEMDSLIDKGCTKFVFDVRGNLGGDLKSIVGVLSYLLEEGDTIITTEWNSGEREEYIAEEHMYDDVYENCSVSSEDIGKYLDRGFEFAVLCDGSTASAAEVFVANFRDHEIGTTVGTTTFGKGVVQSIYNLNMYGFPGGLRITNRMYYPPSGVGYDGIGIKPDDTVEATEKMLSTNIYELRDADDVQLIAAIEHFSK
ncbi:MAG: hypothetical protein J6Q78_04400 [Clostridia bacterium]|nr:hypothetical protein [Clostridia bacterium]